METLAIKMGPPERDEHTSADSIIAAVQAGGARKRTLSQLYTDAAEAAFEQRMRKLQQQQTSLAAASVQPDAAQGTTAAAVPGEAASTASAISRPTQAAQTTQDENKAAKKARGLAKAQAAKAQGNRDLALRTQHLFRAAAYLSSLRVPRRAATSNLPAAAMRDAGLSATLDAPRSDAETTDGVDAPETQAADCKLDGLAARYVADLKGVARKAQLKLPIPLKRRVCKRCDGLLLGDGVSVDVVGGETRRSARRKRGGSRHADRQNADISSTDGAKDKIADAAPFKTAPFDTRVLVMTCSRCHTKKHFPLRKGVPDIAFIEVDV